MSAARALPKVKPRIKKSKGARDFQLRFRVRGYARRWREKRDNLSEPSSLQNELSTEVFILRRFAREPRSAEQIRDCPKLCSFGALIHARLSISGELKTAGFNHWRNVEEP